MLLERLGAMLADFVCRIRVTLTTCVGLCVFFVVQNAAMCFLGVVCLVCESRICGESHQGNNTFEETTSQYDNFGLVAVKERTSHQFTTHTNDTEERITDIFSTLLWKDPECLRFVNVAVLLTTVGFLYAFGGALLGMAFLWKPREHHWCIKQRATAWLLSTSFSLIMPIYTELSTLIRTAETEVGGIFRVTILFLVIFYGLMVFVQSVIYVTCMMSSSKTSRVHSSYSMLCIDKKVHANSK